jgi:hypothetical protein
MGGVYHNNQNETSCFLQHMPIQVWISPAGWSHHSPLCWSNPDSLRHGPQKKDGSEDGKTMENHGAGRNPAVKRSKMMQKKQPVFLFAACGYCTLWCMFVTQFLLLRTCKHLSYDLSPHFSPKGAGTPQSHVAALFQAISQNRLAQNQIPFLTCPIQQYGYGSIPIHTIFRGMNIHLPAILMFTRGTRF